MKARQWILIAACVCLVGGLYVHAKGREHIYGKDTCAIVMKSRNNWYNELAVQGYQEVMEENGKNVISVYPDNISAQEQIRIIRSLIQDNVSAIALAANDEYALTPVLREAMERGISVITLDGDTEPGSRSIYVKPVDDKLLGKELAKEVYLHCGHRGQWAVLSAASRSANQNEWIYAIKEELQEPVYRELRLVDIAYGNGEYEKAAGETRRLLETYPDLKLICSLSTTGSLAAADVIKEEKKEGEVKVIGLGLPGEMAGVTGTGEEDVCPVLYVWDPREMGRLAAHISLGLSEGKLKAQEGETMEFGDHVHSVKTGTDGGLEVISGMPIKVDSENIGYWKTIF
ncbi:MAG: substrate-binding domain-containing protein [Clostridium sp.]|nr:substrate-binding domain-containing protein [Clostridium sp.]